MTNDEQTVGRRVLLRTAVFLGIAAASGLLTGGEAGTPVPGSANPPGPAPAGGPGPVGAAGAPGMHPEGPPDKSYRLRPMTAEAPARPPAAKPAVRTRPILELPADAANADGGGAMVLTFDDGPDPRYTPAILDTLARYGVRGMFFVCGEMATEHRDLLRRMTSEGHVIGNHTWTHPLIPKLGRPALEAEIGRTSEVVQQAVGEPPLWFRAPYGAWNRAAFEIGADLGMEPLAWTVDTLDWKEPGTTTIVSRVMAGAGPGVIVLNHDAGGNRSQSVQALSTYLPQLLARGYRMTLPALPPR
ncbi:polysaccharide deacetylase family protein [Streptomyces sp. NBC_00249]|uniref:polysaccharide deacetylase family protein n=1 Tax=Streptomyces sp. NBC_00249 TaxID=2975690 RepID=UPI002258D8BB|nr:polysaccharide deacetylase family protein [Streptomyces sp. NBC_00249]MCX5192964.1 polysaccharide deacetylase family protein [Streptomyces sp. NBC_00249]